MGWRSSHKQIKEQIDRHVLNTDPASMSQAAREGGPNAGASITRNEIGATRQTGAVTPSIVGANTLYANAHSQQVKVGQHREAVAERREVQLDAAQDKKEQQVEAAAEQRSSTAPVPRPFSTSPRK